MKYTDPSGLREEEGAGYVAPDEQPDVGDATDPLGLLKSGNDKDSLIDIINNIFPNGLMLPGGPSPNPAQAQAEAKGTLIGGVIVGVAFGGYGALGLITSAASTPQGQRTVAEIAAKAESGVKNLSAFELGEQQFIQQLPLDVREFWTNLAPYLNDGERYSIMKAAANELGLKLPF